MYVQAEEGPYHVIYSVRRYKDQPCMVSLWLFPTFHLLQVPNWFTIRVVLFQYYILVLKIYKNPNGLFKLVAWSDFNRIYN